MMKREQIRSWLERDGGAFFDVGNRKMRWYQVVGCLASIMAFFSLGLVKHGVSVAPWVAWSIFIGGGVLFAAPWLDDSVTDPPRESPEDKQDRAA